MTSRALVLGAGGITGIAWELGMLKGLRDAGVDLTTADLVVGTSAGAVVGTQVTTGLDLDELVAMQRSPGPEGMRQAPAVDMERWVAALAGLAQDGPSPQELRARIGAAAMAATTVSQAAVLQTFEWYLPRREWPGRRLLITAVDAATGEPVVWDRDAGVPLLPAVAASCAVPGVWPPVTIAGRRYMDGGVRSLTNLDLAAGARVVVVLAPFTDNLVGGSIQEEIAALGPEAKVAVASPDAASLEEIGPNPLDPSRRAAAVVAGLAQASRAVEAIHNAWAAHQGL